jgi:act minimal PKS acyl carrier protein
MTIDDLRAIMRKTVGEDGPDSVADFATSTFEELGCDSLALLEMSAVISYRFEVRVPDDAMVASRTPGDTVNLVNRLVGVASGER